MQRNHIPNGIDYIEFAVDSADNLRQEQQFLQQVFGWQYKSWGDTYVDTASSGIGNGITVQTPTATPLAPLIVIYTDDLAAAHQRVLDAGGSISVDIFEFPGGKRFHFKTPTGQELAIWSDQS